jgi:LuxR family maltose regulon positive regulatory protein
MPVARELCFVDQLIAGHIVASRLRAAEGDMAGAEHALDDASRVALECNLERLSLAVLNERVRLLIRNGRSETAAHLAMQDGIEEAACQMPRSGSTTTDELRAMIAARVAISQNRATQVLSGVRHWRTFCQHRGAVRSLVRWNLLMAQALMMTGETVASQRVMHEAIVAATPMKAVRSFVDEGPAVLTILSDAYLDAPPTGHPADVFARSVLEAFAWKGRRADIPVAGVEGLYGKLSAKEIEILILVDYGMRNREIGNRLGLTEGSVKWYMQQVYDKVGIRRRSQAVERARRLGLMP